MKRNLRKDRTKGIYAKLRADEHDDETTCLNCRWCGAGHMGHVELPPCDCEVAQREQEISDRCARMGYGIGRYTGD